MTSIYLIRHAEAEGNLYRIAQGQHDSNLTDRGWRQVRALERRFAGVSVDAVYASDLYRTCATASAIYKSHGLTLHRRRDLREIHVGDWEQRTWGEIVRRTPQAMEDFGKRMDRWSIPGAETPGQVLERVRKAVESIAAENPGKTAAVFSHGYAIRLLLANLQGISLRDTGEKSPTGDNTAVSLLEWDGEGLRVVFQNDNSHLQTPEFLAGEKVRKRAVALEPGLWFRPLAGKETSPPILAEAGADPDAPLTLAGFLGEEPVGLLQMDPEEGRIGLVYVRPGCRKRGFGVQLIGQAVQHTRERGGERLTALLPPESPARIFFLDCGFAPGEREAASPDREPLEKHIGFDPEFLGEP
ncbi:MAG: GNAT family N-acetyltransferase [Oscillibacter sp.]|nr:GNAT family N-acetyltransferase [Oscillibacter sp.]